MITRAYVGLGSNLAGPRRQIAMALAELSAIPRTCRVEHSRLYLSTPVGPEQPDYVNAVAAVATQLPARAFLAQLFEIEGRHGRIRTEVRWGPRSLDLDLLLYGDAQSDDPALTLPHPRLHERGFVLYPLYEIAPDLIIPGRGALRELIKHCPRQKVIPLMENNDKL